VHFAALTTLLVFSVAALALIAVPGPNVIYIVACGAPQGHAAAVASALGRGAAAEPRSRGRSGPGRDDVKSCGPTPPWWGNDMGRRASRRAGSEWGGWPSPPRRSSGWRG
jgi:hypothetical protein